MPGITSQWDKWMGAAKGGLSYAGEWQLIATGVIIVLGILLLECFWRHLNQKLMQALGKTDRKEDVLYFVGFLPSLRLFSAGVLLKIGEFLVDLSNELIMLLHGFQALLIALAAFLFFLQLVRIIELIVAQYPADSRKKPSKASFKGLKIGLRVIGILVAAFVFIYIQRDFFPEWLWKYSWMRYPVLGILVSFIFLTGHFLRSILSGTASAMRDRPDKTRVKLVLEAALKTFPFLTTLIAIDAVTSVLTLGPRLDRAAEIITNVLGVLVVFLFVFKLIKVVEYELEKFVEKPTNNFDTNLVQIVRMTARVFVMAFSAIFLVQVVTGKSMTSILAALGIGGLAVALAAQDTLKNLFGSFMIMLDKPFVVGDWVTSLSEQGIVEDIGFRSTKIRTFGGNLITIPNDRLAASNIENFQRRPYIRRWADIAITYDTPPDKVERSVQIIKEILNNREEIDPDIPPRVYFNDFNATSLNILMVYYFRKNDYWGSVEFDEKVNFEIMRAFEAEGIEMAFPTAITYLAQDDRKPLNIRLSGEPHPKRALKNGEA